MITLTEFSDIIQVSLEMRYHNGQRRFSVLFEHGEIQDGNFLRGSSGNGKTPDEAMADYCKQISGKTLIVNAYGENRREFGVPEVEWMSRRPE